MSCRLYYSAVHSKIIATEFCSNWDCLFLSVCTHTCVWYVCFCPYLITLSRYSFANHISKKKINVLPTHLFTEMKFHCHNCRIHIFFLKSRSICNIFSFKCFQHLSSFAIFISKLKNRCYPIDYHETISVWHQFKRNKLSLSCLVVVACIFTEGCKVRHSAVVSDPSGAILHSNAASPATWVLFVFMKFMFFFFQEFFSY